MKTLSREAILRMTDYSGGSSTSVAGGSGGGGGGASQAWVDANYIGKDFLEQAFTMSKNGVVVTPNDTDTGIDNVNVLVAATMAGAVTMGSTLSVTGAVTMGSTLAVDGNITIGTKLVATQEWTDNNYVSIGYFSRLFHAYNGNTAVNPNDLTTTIDNIKAMFGFWTDFYISALGNGGQASSAIYLSGLADVDVTGVQNGQALVWNSTLAKWVPGTGGGGADMNTVWAALAASTSEQINASHLATALSGYLPLTGGTLSGTNNVLNINSSTSYSWIYFLTNSVNKASIGYYEGLAFIANETTYARIGVNDAGTPQYWSGVSSSTAQTLWHSGNFNPGNYLPLTGGTMTGAITLSGTTIIQNQANTSNYTTAITWYKGGTSQDTYNPQIGQYNMGGSGTGSITILPYATSTDPWLGNVGLYIAAGTLKIDGVDVITASNISLQSVAYATSAGSATTAGSASRLTGDTSYTAWGQSFWSYGTPNNVSGDMTNVGDICLNSSKRIYGTSDIYIGDSNNANWVKCEDICSSQGSGAWNIRRGGDATFANMLSNGYVTALSDIRQKDVIKDFALDVHAIANARMIKFTWKDKRDELVHVGGVAQEWQTILPESVTETEDGSLAMDYGVIALMSAISLARVTVNHEQRIAQLENEIRRLKSLIK